MLLNYTLFTKLFFLFFKFYIFSLAPCRSKFWEFIFSPSLQDRLFRIGDGLKMNSQNLLLFWKINSSNSGTRGCGAGPSRVTLNLSVYKAYKKISPCISQHFSMLFLLSEGHFLGFFTQAKSLRTWHLVILETPARLQFWKMVTLETKGLMVYT